ncbi:MAG TPA: hypothetical protein PKA41_09560 [Verrucomicrobiota bacterium]|nr:hypothetical protein [Verrucomicrobiota bacterium]
MTVNRSPKFRRGAEIGPVQPIQCFQKDQHAGPGSVTQHGQDSRNPQSTLHGKCPRREFVQQHDMRLEFFRQQDGRRSPASSFASESSVVDRSA